MRTRACVHLVTAITMFACTTPSQEPRRSQNPTVAVQATPEQRVVPPPPTTPRRPPCDAGAAPDAPLLSLQTQGTHGMEFSETTIVGCDGQVSVRALRPFSSSEAVVSTLRLDPDELERGRAIALDMMRAPETVLALPPQGADTMAVAHSEPVASGRADTSAAHGAAFAWLREVTDRARQHPEYTVTLSVLGHRDNTLAIRIANRGRRPISLFVDERETRGRGGAATPWCVGRVGSDRAGRSRDSRARARRCTARRRDRRAGARGARARGGRRPPGRSTERVRGRALARAHTNRSSGPSY